MRFGLTILPEHSWSVAEPMWREAEQMGFDHAWTFDHVTWGGLPDSPWFGAVPTLAAAASVTERIGLGTFVSSPNNHHPVQFMREVLALDDISHGRFLLGVGAGGDVGGGFTARRGGCRRGLRASRHAQAGGDQGEELLHRHLHLTLR